MAIGIYFDGRRLIRPQAVSKIDDSAMYGRGLGGANTLAVLGEATGGEPNKVYYFTDPSYAKTIFRSGNLLTAIQRAYDPSNETPGAYTVAAIRVNPALQSKLSFTDATGNPLIRLTSVDYGVWNNQIRGRVETGTSSGTKKVTFSYGADYDQGDNIQKKSIYLGCTDPMAVSALATISQGTMTASKTLVTTVTASPVTDTIGTAGVFYPNGTTTVVPAALTLRFPTFASQYCFVGSDQPFSSINVTVGVANVIAATLTLGYWNGSVWATVVGKVDGTESPAGTTLGATGTISFTQPTDWVKTGTTTTPTGPTVSMYWIMIMSSAALTVTATQTNITVGRGLTASFSTYTTVQELIDYIDAQPHYEAVAATSSPTTDLSTELDAISGSNFLTTVTTLNATATTTTLSVVSNTGFAIGDYITVSTITGVWEEIRRITGVSGSTYITVDSALSSTTAYISGSKVRKALVLNSDVQAIIDWINAGNTAYVTAAYPATTWQPSTAYVAGDVVLPSTANDRFYVCTTAGTSGTSESVLTAVTTIGNLTASDNGVYWMCRLATRATVANQADTFMSGGSEGTTAQTNWDSALNLLQNEDTPLITCVSYDPAVWASLSTHCSYMSGIGKKERIGFCGGFATADGYTNGLGKWSNTTVINASIDQMQTYALTLNSDRMVYVGPGFKAYDENGTLTTYGGAISAALVAGMAAGVDVAEALTHDSINVIGLEYNFRWSDLDELLENGICPLEYDPASGYRVCQSITTWLVNDKYNRRELSVRRTSDYVARQVRERLEMDFVGKKGTSTTLISIKNATISVLQQMYRLELLAGDANNPPYKNIQCRLEADTCYVEFECSPVIPINYIPVTVHLTVFTTTLTA